MPWDTDRFTVLAKGYCDAGQLANGVEWAKWKTVKKTRRAPMYIWGDRKTSRMG
jgi:hypothetical protein